MKKVELFENERAAKYNLFVERWIPNYHYYLDQLPKILKEVHPKDLLIAGCGNGNEIDRFLHTTEKWMITGVDPSPQMISKARRDFGRRRNVKLIDGVVADLDKKKKFAAATLSLVLHFFKDNGDKLNLLKDISHRLLPGAPLLLLDITGNRECLKQNLQILRLLLPDGLDPEEIERRQQRVEHELFAVSEERLAELCEQAGFQPPIRFFQSTIYMGWLIKKKECF